MRASAPIGAVAKVVAAEINAIEECNRSTDIAAATIAANRQRSRANAGSHPQLFATTTYRG